MDKNLSTMWNTQKKATFFSMKNWIKLVKGSVRSQNYQLYLQAHLNSKLEIFASLLQFTLISWKHSKYLQASSKQWRVTLLFLLHEVTAKGELMMVIWSWPLKIVNSSAWKVLLSQHVCYGLVKLLCTFAACIGLPHYCLLRSHSELEHTFLKSF